MAEMDFPACSGIATDLGRIWEQYLSNRGENERVLIVEFALCWGPLGCQRYPLHVRLLLRLEKLGVLLKLRSEQAGNGQMKTSIEAVTVELFHNAAMALHFLLLPKCFSLLLIPCPITLSGVRVIRMFIEKRMGVAVDLQLVVRSKGNQIQQVFPISVANTKPDVMHLHRVINHFGLLRHLVIFYHIEVIVFFLGTRTLLFLLLLTILVLS